MAQARSCDRCQYWAPDWGLKKPSKLLKDGRSKQGQCHRYAPQSSALSLSWPMTKSEIWCGDFEPRKNERRKARSENL